jgi:hypothetical protein
VQDNYYYWASYETLRRLALTSLVVVVQIIDTDFAVLYTMLVAFASVIVQAYYRPFKEDKDDLLTVFFMVNEFLLAVTMLCEQHWNGWSGGSFSGMVLTALTALALLCALHRAQVFGKVQSVLVSSFSIGRGKENAAAASEKHSTDEEVAQPPASPATDAKGAQTQHAPMHSAS